MPGHLEQRRATPAKSNLGALKARRPQETEPRATLRFTTKSPLPLFGEALASITLLSIFLLSGTIFRNILGRGVERPIVAAEH